MNMAVMAPELEEAGGTPDDVLDNDNDDDDKPGWLVSFMDGKQPILVRLDGTDDDELSTEDVFERFDKADKSGHSFFKLGTSRIRMVSIRDLSWSEDVDLPEMVVFDSLQDRIENVLDGLEDTAQAIGQAAQGTVVLQEQMIGLQSAQAQLFDAVDAEGDLGDDLEDEGAKAAAPVQPVKNAAKPGGLKPLRMGAPTKLPPGVNPSVRP